MSFHMKHKKYKIIKRCQKGGSHNYEEDAIIYKRFVQENLDEINFVGVEMDHHIIEKKRREYIDCYQGVFREMMEKILYGVRHISFVEFRDKLFKLCDILASLKKPNDVYVLLLVIPDDTIRNDSYAKSNFWTSNLLTSRIGGHIDYVVEFVKKGGVYDIDNFLEYLGMIDKYQYSQIVYIMADDCSYSGSQIKFLNEEIKSIDKLNENENQYVWIVPYILKNYTIMNIKEIVGTTRFNIIYDEIHRNSIYIENIKKIVNDNIELYNECMYQIELLKQQPIYKQGIKKEYMIKRHSIFKIFIKNQHFIVDNDKIECDIDNIIFLYDDVNLFDISYDRNSAIYKKLLYIAKKYNDTLIDLSHTLIIFRFIKSKIKDVFETFYNLKNDQRYLLYFDFTFADSASNNRQILSGFIYNDEFPGYFSFNGNTSKYIPFINRCNDINDVTKNCPDTYYKNIIYNVNGHKLFIKEMSSKMISTKTGLFEFLKTFE